MSKRVPSGNEPHLQSQAPQQPQSEQLARDAYKHSVQQTPAGEAAGQQQKLASGISAETERLLQGLLTPVESVHGSSRSRRGDIRLTDGSANTGSDGSAASLVRTNMLYLQSHLTAD